MLIWGGQKVTEVWDRCHNLFSTLAASSQCRSPNTAPAAQPYKLLGAFCQGSELRGMARRMHQNAPQHKHPAAAEGSCNSAVPFHARGEANCSTIGHKVVKRRGQTQGLLPSPFCNQNGTKDQKTTAWAPRVTAAPKQSPHTQPFICEGLCFPKGAPLFVRFVLQAAGLSHSPPPTLSHHWSVNQVWRAAPSLNYLIGVWKIQGREAEGMSGQRATRLLKAGCNQNIAY